MNNVAERLAALPAEKRNLLMQRLSATIRNGALPIRRQPRPDRALGHSFPLSFAQERMWFNHQWAPNSPLYNETLVMRFAGPLQVNLLEPVMHTILCRHEILRTTFAQQDGELVQTVLAPQAVGITWVDLRDVAENARTDAIEQQVSAAAQQPFDLAQWPLFRITLLQVAAEEHVLIFVVHHIIFDGWSAGVILPEIFSLYTALAKNQPAALPESPIQYVDYAVWQRETLPAVSERQLAYWLQQLAQAPAHLELPTDRPRPPVRSSHGASSAFTLPAALTDAIYTLGRQHNATPFMTLLAAFTVLLYRYSGQDDIVVGTPVANRNRSELEGMIGVFTNTLALRTQLNGHQSFQTLLRNIRQTTVDAFAHQELPFETLVEKLQPARDLSRPPLFQVMFDLQKSPPPPATPTGLAVSFAKVHTGTAKFDLSLLLVESDQGLAGEFEYSTDLFDEATITRMIGHFQQLLAGLVMDAQQAIGALPLLTEVERHQLLMTWNATERVFPHTLDKCAHELFEAQVARTPDAIAITFADSTMTYHELNRRANQLAHYLQSRGVGSGTIVGIGVERSSEMIVGLLGVLKAGAAYLPLNLDYPKERLAFMCTDAQIQLLLTEQPLVDALPTLDVPVLCLDVEQPMITRMNAQNPIAHASADDLAYIIYTSGSTGTPKGVLLAHRGLCNLAEANRHWFAVDATSRLLQFASFGFDGSVYEIFVTLLAGATLCMGSRSALQPGPDLTRLLREQAITHAILPPAVLTVLPDEPLPALRALISSGDACSMAVMERWSAGRRFINGYGPTEGTVCTTLHESVSNGQLPPIGRPIANVQVYLLDSLLQPVPIGVTGELYIGGAGLAQGYLGRPALTAERFIPNPFCQSLSPGRGDRLYRSGDLARYLPNGEIVFVGRADQQVKVRGFRIELGEIEAVLRQHPAVQAATVLVREVNPDDKRLVAYVVLAAQPVATHQELYHFVRGKLPEHMTPTAFMTLEALPLTASGKIDQRALPMPETFEGGAQATYVAPRDPVEEILAEIWAQCLGVGQVGIHDNFFQLGGHSLLITRLLAQVTQVFQVQLPARIFFEAPTVAGLAEAMLAHEPRPGQVKTIAQLRKRISSMAASDIQKALQARKAA